MRKQIDDQVRRICEDPELGTLKIGDLADVRVHKFGFLGRLYLLAYEVDEGAKIIRIYAVGGHENWSEPLRLDRWVKKSLSCLEGRKEDISWQATGS